jgi:cold shock CspA family protein
VNDTADGGADTYTLVDGLLTKPGAGAFVSLDYSFINQTLIDCNSSANVFNFTDGFGFPTVQGNGGADTFNVISTNSSATTPTIHGGAGLDELFVNQDEVGTATAVLDQDEDFASFNMYIGSTVNVLSNGNTGIVTDSFGFARGTLNLTNNFMVVQTPSVSFLVDKLRRGYNAGGWNGVPAGGASGVIRSSTAAGSALLDGLGYGEVGAAAGQLNIASYRGAAVAAGDLIISYTLHGDANLDRSVTSGDFNLLASNFGLTGRNWVQGNFNYDLPNSATDSSDFNMLASTFGTSVPGDTEGARGGAGGSLFGDRKIGDDGESDEAGNVVA